MTLFVYGSKGSFNTETEPLEVVANTPFIVEFERHIVRIVVCNKTIDTAFFDYEIVGDRLNIWKEA